MAYLTFDEIHKSSRLVEASLRKSEGDGKKIFLSHSSKDNSYVLGVEKFLENYGCNVYSDNGDKRLPETPSPETADILRGEINGADRFVVMISKESANSGWIPWELGFADGKRGLSNVAVLPINGTTVEEAWAKREYLGLYPVVRKATIKGKTGEHWIVQLPDGKFFYLSKWLN